MDQTKSPIPWVVPLVLLCFWAFPSVLAQQNYRSTKLDYRCTDLANKSCNSFVLYRTTELYRDLPGVANLFRVNESELARLNEVSSMEPLYLGRPLVIPVICECVNSSSMYLLKYVIKDGDTFWLLSTATFDSLATTNAIVFANNDSVPTNLDIGQLVNIPIRCACPTASQRGNGTTTLMTYSIQSGDTISTLAALFNVPAGEILAANELGPEDKIFEDETLIIPYKVSEPFVRAVPPPPPAPGSGPSSNESPPPTPPLAPPREEDDDGGTNIGVYIGIGVGGGALLVVIVGGICCGYLIYKRKSRRTASDLHKHLGVHQPLPSSSFSAPSPVVSSHEGRAPGGGHSKAVDILGGMFDVVDRDKPTVFTYEEIRDATKNFAPEYRIQGSVYRAVLNNQVVAVKQTKDTTTEELKLLCRVHHSNLIKLVGMCVTEAEHMYLVYEYAENGSLSDALHTDFLSRNKNLAGSSSFLGWTTRVQIAVDAASGLEYIHDYVNPSYVHKDVKSSNILLDRGFRAKIANFAMAKSGGSQMTRHIDGTYGYMAPEYLAHGLVTTKADVFAFGVTLLELLSVKEAILEDENGQERCLYECIGPILEGDDQTVKSNLRGWIDPVLESNYPLDIAQQLALLAKSCVEMDPALRPRMKDVTYTLTNLLKASLEWESSAVFANPVETSVEGR